MDLHPDAQLPPAARTPLGPTRSDSVKLERDSTVAQLRARLLKLIVAQEQSRSRSGGDATKPR